MLKKRTSQKKLENIVPHVIESKNYQIIDGKRIDSARQYIRLVHRNYDGTFAVGVKQSCKDWKAFSQWTWTQKEFEECVPLFLNVAHLYITINGFWNTRRRIKDIRHLKAFYVDVDYYKNKKYANKTVEELVEIMRTDGVFQKAVIEPSFFIDSGRGMYIIWLIESAPKQALGLWQLCEDKLIQMFEEYGADVQASDPARFLRMAGSTHGTTKDLVKIIWNKKVIGDAVFEQEKEKHTPVYMLGDFEKALLPKFEVFYNKEQRQKFKAKLRREKDKTIKHEMDKQEQEGNKLVFLFNIYTLHMKRSEDMESLVDIRRGDCEGCRELILFFYRYWVMCIVKDTEKAMQMMRDLNDRFIYPLNDEEAEEATKSAEGYYELWQKTFNEYQQKVKQGKKFNQLQMNKLFYQAGCYIPTNSHIIKKLKITQEEMAMYDHEKQEHVFKTLFNKKEKDSRDQPARNERKKKARRNEEGLTSKEQGFEDNLQKVKELLEKGLNKTQIAKELDVSRRMIYKYIDELKKREEDNKIIRVEEVETSEIVHDKDINVM